MTRKMVQGESAVSDGKKVKIAHMFTPEQAEVLRREAYRRAEARKSRKPDESEVVREAVDLWIAKQGGKK